MGVYPVIPGEGPNRTVNFFRGTYYGQLTIAQRFGWDAVSSCSYANLAVVRSISVPLEERSQFRALNFDGISVTRVHPALVMR